MTRTEVVAALSIGCDSGEILEIDIKPIDSDALKVENVNHR